MFHVKQSVPHVLLVNPWITDFSAYDFWIRPLGLLSVATALRNAGARVSLIDCLDHRTKTKETGEGKFPRTRIEKPPSLASIPKRYSRYGIPEEAFAGRLSRLDRPDVVGVTSGMTYWYPGAFRVIELIRDRFHDVPILLGGIYATLCPDHARRFSGADLVIEGEAEGKVLGILKDIISFPSGPSFNAAEGTSLSPPLSNDIPPSVFRFPSDASFSAEDPSRSPSRSSCGIPHSAFRFPSYDLYPSLSSIALFTSRGCPFQCTYCASHLLTGTFRRRVPMDVVEEIEHWTVSKGVKDIAFYDDALLVDPERHIVPVLREVLAREIQCRFHSPNGLHCREITFELSDLLLRAGFKTIRLGFETSDEAAQAGTGGKVDNQTFRRAVANLKRAGYDGRQVGVYLLAGLPGQRVEEVVESIAYVREAGARPMIAEYSPIPGTTLFEEARRVSRYDLEREPLFHNNSLLPCLWDGFTLNDYHRLRDLAKCGQEPGERV
jgi:radical SAM superfamily enzyme YgiQ (UPF0313 family)